MEIEFPQASKTGVEHNCFCLGIGAHEMLGMSLSMRGRLYGYTGVEHVGNDTVMLIRVEFVLRLKIVKS